MTQTQAIKLLNEMKEITLQVRLGKLSYHQGKIQTAPMLKQYNEIARLKAKKLGRKWYDLNFTKLVRIV